MYDRMRERRLNDGWGRAPDDEREVCDRWNHEPAQQQTGSTSHFDHISLTRPIKPRLENEDLGFGGGGVCITSVVTQTVSPT